MRFEGTKSKYCDTYFYQDTQSVITIVLLIHFIKETFTKQLTFQGKFTIKTKKK